MIADAVYSPKVSPRDLADLRMSCDLALKTYPSLRHRQLMLDVCDELAAARLEIKRLQPSTLIALKDIHAARMSDCPACKGLAASRPDIACAVCHDLALAAQPAPAQGEG